MPVEDDLFITDPGEAIVFRDVTCQRTRSSLTVRAIAARSQRAAGAPASSARTFSTAGAVSARGLWNWLARKDSNLQSPDPESGALPLGHSPVPERSPNLVRPTFRDESVAHSGLPSLPPTALTARMSPRSRSHQCKEAEPGNPVVSIDGLVDLPSSAPTTVVARQHRSVLLLCANAREPARTPSGTHGVGRVDCSLAWSSSSARKRYC